MDTPEGTDVRCSTVVFRDDALLLIHRARDGTDDWTAPTAEPASRGGTLRASRARLKVRAAALTGAGAEP